MRAEAIRRRDLAGPYQGADYDSGEDEAHAALTAGSQGPRLEYRVASTGACVTLSNAKSLLFYFCNKLPSDRWATCMCISCHERLPGGWEFAKLCLSNVATALG